MLPTLSKTAHADKPVQRRKSSNPSAHLPPLRAQAHPKIAPKVACARPPRRSNHDHYHREPSGRHKHGKGPLRSCELEKYQGILCRVVFAQFALVLWLQKGAVRSVRCGWGTEATRRSNISWLTASCHHRLGVRASEEVEMWKPFTWAVEEGELKYCCREKLCW